MLQGLQYLMQDVHYCEAVCWQVYYAVCIAATVVQLADSRCVLQWCLNTCVCVCQRPAAKQAQSHVDTIELHSKDGIRTVRYGI
jgi:hypothetical protein